MEIGRSGDRDRAFGLLRALIGVEADPDRMFFISQSGSPVSKARARWSRKSRRFYTPDKSSGAESDLALRFRSIGIDTLDANVAMVAVFFRPNRQRIDADNLMKLVLDAGTKAGLWRDDCQVTAQASVIEMDAERPRTLVAWAPIESTLDRAIPAYKCRQCGAEFTGIRAHGRKPIFCSRACMLLGQARAPLEPVPCGMCGATFQRQEAGARYCSDECRLAALHANNRKRGPIPPCASCGGPVTRRGSRRCRPCFLAAARGRSVAERSEG